MIINHDDRMIVSKYVITEVKNIIMTSIYYNKIAQQSYLI